MLEQAFHATGWTRQAVLNVPNALSMGRLISGPFVAYLILQGHWPAAMGTLAVAGAHARHACIFRLHADLQDTLRMLMTANGAYKA